MDPNILQPVPCKKRRSKHRLIKRKKFVKVKKAVTYKSLREASKEANTVNP